MVLVGWLAAAAPVLAQSGGWRPDGFFLEAGQTRRETDLIGLGLRWTWNWQSLRWGGQFSGGTELSLSRWSARLHAGRDNQAQLALVPLLRWTPDQGSSRWFVEAGIGLSLHQRRYETDDMRMSTRWNFVDTVALGRRLGPDDELSLRFAHVSNAGIKKPNPGEEMLMLRWARRF